MKKKSSERRINYSTWTWTKGELFTAIMSGAGLVSLIDWLFYRSLVLLPFLSPFVLVWVRLIRKDKIARRKEQLNADFQVALHSLAMSLKAGYSVENAFPQAAQDLRMLVGENAPMYLEFRWITSQISIRVPPDTLVSDFAVRSGVEDIENFAEVFACARKSGGNLAAVLQNTADVIESKIETEKAIASTLASRQFEQRIMSVMPAGIILYMRLASPGYLDCLYGNAFGVIIMTLCLTVYILAILWSQRLVHIEI